MPQYHCPKCKFTFQIDWSQQTLCADCASIEKRNAKEDPESYCNQCGSYSFIYPFEFTSNLACPKCGSNMHEVAEGDNWEGFKSFSD
ncbi:MAG: hypothetical protein ACFFCZ_19870 [Promethearchaeota archaeon]